MKTRWFVFGCLTSIVVLLVLGGLFTLSLVRMSKGTMPQVEDKNVLLLNLSGPVREYSQLKNDRMNFVLEQQTTVHQIKAALQQAADDERIIGVLLKPSWVQGGYALMHELGEAIEEFKLSGKPVIAYLEMCGNKDYFLASYADTILLNSSESGGIMLSGVGTSIIYYKELFDKLGVDVHVIHSGQYKGTGEQYTRSTMSDAMRTSIDGVFAGIYDEVLQEIGRNRNLSIDMMHRIYEDRSDMFVSGTSAQRAGLVDSLVTQDAAFAGFSGVKHYISWRDYPIDMPVLSKANRIAVIYAEGTIAAQSGAYNNPTLTSRKFDAIIDDINEDTSVRAVVLRINSPGGSALESELIYQQLRRIYKPVVVSMSNVAASGGYYISCTADYVFADPFCITGSIGVVSMLPDLHKLAQKAGIQSEQVSYGKFGVMYDPWNATPEHTLAAFRKGSSRTYAEFKKRVATSRNMTDDQVEQVAQGRIWTTRQASENGLVDSAGTLQDAIDKAAELAGISGYSIAWFPKQYTFLELLLDRDFSFTQAAAKYLWATEPEELRQLKGFLEQVKIDGHQLTVAPELYEIVFGDCNF
jgi:protease-4